MKVSARHTSRGLVNAGLFLFALLAGFGSVTAQGGADSNVDPSAKRQELSELLARYKALDPERRRSLRKLYKEKLESKSPSERKRLRRLARQRAQKTRAQRAKRDRLAKQRQRFAKVDQQRKQRYRKLLRRLMQDLPREERRELAMLPQEQRQKRIRQLLRGHREGEIHRRINNLPASVRGEIDVATEGLEGRERFRAVRKRVHEFVRSKAKLILRDEELTAAEKQRRLRALLVRYVPRERARRHLMNKFRKQARGRTGKRAGRTPAERRARMRREAARKEAARKKAARKQKAERRNPRRDRPARNRNRVRKTRG